MTSRVRNLVKVEPSHSQGTLKEVTNLGKRGHICRPTLSQIVSFLQEKANMIQPECHSCQETTVRPVEKQILKRSNKLTEIVLY